MKYILTILIIIVMLIGIYTYAHINRYQLTSYSGVFIILDRWTGRTYYTDPSIQQSKGTGAWIDMGKPRAGEYTIPP